ncbi:hypothetical protein [Nocardia terpenica]|uniref:MmyB family transcriptional regulator n=1 Tax=Nocardia terpenica TaxID=455432 RepID=UPI0019325C56
MSKPCQALPELTALAGTTFTHRAHARLTPTRAGIEQLRHPHAGQLRLAFETLTLPDTDGQHLIVYLPDDEPTATRLDRLLRTGPSALPPAKTPTAPGISAGSPARTPSNP